MSDGMHKISIKTEKEINIMREGGSKLNFVKNRILKSIKVGVNAMEIEELATDLIEKSNSKPSFKMVPGYKWSTCINVNDGLVHGIPKRDVVFKDGDVVSVDLGLYSKGYHTDTSLTLGLNVNGNIENFLSVGKKALKNAIQEAKVGSSIYDISLAIQTVVEKAGYSPIRALVGHGIGKFLHEEPQIPCYVDGKRENSPILVEGMVIAIEVMYAMGSSDIKIADDRWTISTRDGKISALYEDTVAITKKGPLVLT